jgi:hypothetical protein
MSLMTPNWSCSIQAHILAETTVGMAHGTSMAARSRPRPRKPAFRISAMPTPSTVSNSTVTPAKASVLPSAFQNSRSASRPYQPAASRVR